MVTHTDGHNQSGNIHTHIVINSVRKYSADREPYMTQPHDHEAGYKHRSTDKFLEHFKKEVMDMCLQEGLHQIDQVDYTPRFDNVQNNYWECTGNIKNLIVETSVDGETWTAVTEDGGRDLSKKIVKENNSSFFPEEITFEAKEARYVRISGTKSHHWQTQNVDKQITVADRSRDL